ncbi:uncharacterized protein ISCGN_030150 [Ixodes scapularis]
MPISWTHACLLSLLRIPCGYGSIWHLSFSMRRDPPSPCQAPDIIYLRLARHAYDGSSENQREYHEGDKRVEASCKGRTPETRTISNQGDEVRKLKRQLIIWATRRKSETVRWEICRPSSLGGMNICCSYSYLR